MMSRLFSGGAGDGGGTGIGDGAEVGVGGVGAGPSNTELRRTGGRTEVAILVAPGIGH